MRFAEVSRRIPTLCFLVRSIPALVAGFAVGAAFPIHSQQVPYDVVIVGGDTIYGTGNPPIRADVGIRADKIVTVGFLDHARAKRTIDARGLTIVPGFIDMHSHADDASGASRGLRSPHAKRRAAAAAC